MASESSPRAVRFSQGSQGEDDIPRPEKPKTTRPQPTTIDSDNSGSSGDSNVEALHALERQDGLGSLDRYAESLAGSVSSLTAGPVVNGVTSRLRGGADLNNPNSYASSSTPRPTRPTGPARTPSNTYQPARRPTGNAPSFIHTGSDHRSTSKPRLGTANSTFRAQEREYIRQLRQQGHINDYFDAQGVNGGSGDYADSDSEGETPSSDAPFDDRYDQETIMFYNNDDLHPTEEDIADPTNRERLEWHGMLEAVLTGDVVRQEKKRLIGSTEEAVEKTAQKAELWLGIRSKKYGRYQPLQRRMVEDARKTIDKMIDDVIHFKVEGESEAGKPPIDQIHEVVEKIEKIESLYPSRSSLLAAHKDASSTLYKDACDVLLSWNNANELINTELTILKNWVGNDELDFNKTREKSPSGQGLSDESSFLDRLIKEEGLKSLHDHAEEDGKSKRKSMLYSVSMTVRKVKEIAIENSEFFEKRHLPSFLEELMTLLSFPSRLIEEIIKMRLDYARKMKESAQQNSMMQEQMITQFEVLLNLTIDIKMEYVSIFQPEPGWELPPCIDESFDQVVVDALRYYFKVLNWKLSGNKNTFKEAELLFQKWEFANYIGGHLQHGDIEVAEQFSSLTSKTFNRLNQTFDKELQRKPKESVEEMSKRYKQLLDSVRVRQRMLQRFYRTLSDNYENSCDFSISFDPQNLRLFYDRLVESGHFQIYTGSLEREGICLLASPSLLGRHEEIQELLRKTAYDEVLEDFSNPYVLILRPESAPHWYGSVVSLNVREEPLDLKVGHMRLIAGGSQVRLVNARKSLLEQIDMHLDLVVEQRSNLKKVNIRLMDIRRTAYRLSDAFMDSVERIRAQTKGLDCQDLIQTCFVSATEFGQRSLLYMDKNRRQMNNMKLRKLALDWVGFICDDCMSSDRKTFRWAVLALEFAMGMTRGRHILGLDTDEYAMLRSKVAGCMSLLISHFDIMGARSSIAAQVEQQKLEAAVASKRLDKSKFLNDEEAAEHVIMRRVAQLETIEESRKMILSERSALGRVLEVSNEVDRSLAYLSSTATNFNMRWQQGHFVGGGTFGNVYAAMNLDNGQLMAVKEIRLQDPKLIPSIATAIKDEMRVLEAVDHPNVVSYYGIEVHRDRVYIFMEFCSGGSLASLLEHGRIEDEQVIMVYALQLLEGLAYLHEIKIAHRDIKPENILLDHMGIIKYVDFGAAKVIARQGKTIVQDLTSTQPNKSMTGTPMYMSPEVIKGENPGHFGAVDVWSLGCVILEMATGRRPWANLDNEWAIMYNIAQGNPPPMPSPDQLSPQGIDFLNKCFLGDSKKRASAIELLQHEWIMTIRNRVVEPATPSDTSSNAQSTPSSAAVSKAGEGFY